MFRRLASATLVIVLGVTLSAWFADRSWWQIAAFALILNVGVVANSVALWQLFARLRGVTDLARPISDRDRLLTASTTVANAAGVLPAWWLWKADVIELPSVQPGRVLFELVYLTIAVDLVMYWAHRVFHLDPLYRWFHQVHHTDDSPNNALTLFVMHPAEALGFSTLVTVLLILWPVSVLGVAIFFMINLVTGTLAHVMTTRPPTGYDRIFGGSQLHQAHHDTPRSAYGFFTTVSDRLFGSLPDHL